MSDVSKVSVFYYRSKVFIVHILIYSDPVEGPGHDVASLHNGSCQTEG